LFAFGLKKSVSFRSPRYNAHGNSLLAMKRHILSASIIAFALSSAVAAEPRSVSGIYPHLAMFNNEGECGTGAVVPWAGRLWAVTYAPHQPQGSSDKLYEITPSLELIVRPESIGGTPANRMIHRESNQLFIGPYVIDGKGAVRTIPYSTMFGRPTGNARHLFDPAGKIYAATMEEGLYEIDVKTLDVRELWADEQKKEGRHADLPGYHGKGLYSGFGRIIYANNGDHAPEARWNPAVPSGVLAEWDGKAEGWTVVRRNQFTEVTGPGGIYGSENPDKDPIWAVGWDHRSLILQVMDGGKWSSFRLPKASHSYDGAHGWNTEWPRIRELGKGDYVMTMHGMFWQFSGSFSSAKPQPPTPLSGYLKVIGDFTEWQGKVVLGCDDTAKSEFLNKRKAKGEIRAPQSQSNLWFLDRAQLGKLGPAIGRGAVWMQEDVEAGVASDAFAVAGWDRRGLHLRNGGSEAVRIVMEGRGSDGGEWSRLDEVAVEAGAYAWVELKPENKGWVRLRSEKALKNFTAAFSFSNDDGRKAEGADIFKGLAAAGESGVIDGTVRARPENKRDLHFLTSSGALYALDASLALKPVTDEATVAFEKTAAVIPAGVLSSDAASVLFVDDAKKRWRIPRGTAAYDKETKPSRVCREVATERDLFNAYGTFFELPAQNAGGFIKARAVATHNRHISDYCSYRGLFVLSGVSADAAAGEHIIRSEDGKAALWVGAIDDAWKSGKPRGFGGPWSDSAVEAGVPSDPYLATGYDKKRVSLSHKGAEAVKMSVQADITGTGEWATVKEFSVEPGKTVEHAFPDAFTTYWFRVVADKSVTATAQFVYE
jgi:hypothetical protein